MISWWLPYLAKGLTPDFNNGPGNDFSSDVSKQINSALGQVHLRERNIILVV